MKFSRVKLEGSYLIDLDLIGDERGVRYNDPTFNIKWPNFNREWHGIDSL